MRMRSKLLSVVAGLALIAPSAAFAMAYNLNGYVPNSRSPVVGGWDGDVGSYTGTRCYDSNSCYNYTNSWRYYRPFGDVNLGTGYWNWAGTWIGGISCPNNTAQIRIGSGYLADNGVWYNSINVGWRWIAPNQVYVCVNSDTAQGWYGGQ